jgi:hypothetical protein
VPSRGGRDAGPVACATAPWRWTRCTPAPPGNPHGRHVAVRRHEVGWWRRARWRTGSGWPRPPRRAGAPDAPPMQEDLFRIRGAAAEHEAGAAGRGAGVRALPHGGADGVVRAGVLSSARLYVGGAPPRFDGGLRTCWTSPPAAATPSGTPAPARWTWCRRAPRRRGRCRAAPPTWPPAASCTALDARGGGAPASPTPTATGWCVDVPLAGRGAARHRLRQPRRSPAWPATASSRGGATWAARVRYRGGLLGAEGELTLAGGEDAAHAAARRPPAGRGVAHGARARGAGPGVPRRARAAALRRLVRLHAHAATGWTSSSWAASTTW